MSELPPYEKLGAFYLGRRWEPESEEVTDEAYLYDSKDLTTHAVCVGMTGSRKTGLCVSRLEEAALDGVLALVIDRKGDLGNLLLTFPGLSAREFRPWIDESEGLGRGVEPGAYARQTAKLWREGLVSWGQVADRVARLRQSADFAIYTPGSTAGLPLTVLRSFSVPPSAVIADREALNELLAWTRAQPGTSSLRALLYMDEIFGFFPPTAEPPAKRPMLTLLKQARAYGVGVVLATQNPVDLDFKGLANTGTWFIGRLQTERDKARVLEGLEGASAASGASFDRGRMEQALAGLGGRVFLAHNVHEDAPTLFHTRWVMSYLRGPLTRTQIAELMAERKGSQADTSRAAVSPAAGLPGSAPAAASAGDAGSATERPVLGPGIQELFLAPRQAAGDHQRRVLRPALAGAALRERSYAGWRRRLTDHLYQSERMTLWKCPTLADDVERLEGSLDVAALPDAAEVAPRKSDMDVTSFGLAWTPWSVDAMGIAEPLF
ncbi:MAG: hypothetical protein VYE73_15655 [Acidobacteriota bacterium]|nr:hypothetical protein [Acidobacteriota bacterium]